MRVFDLFGRRFFSWRRVTFVLLAPTVICVSILLAEKVQGLAVYTLKELSLHAALLFFVSAALFSLSISYTLWLCRLMLRLPYGDTLLGTMLLLVMHLVLLVLWRPVVNLITAFILELVFIQEWPTDRLLENVLGPYWWLLQSIETRRPFSGLSTVVYELYLKPLTPLVGLNKFLFIFARTAEINAGIVHQRASHWSGASVRRWLLLYSCYPAHFDLVLDCAHPIPSVVQSAPQRTRRGHPRHRQARRDHRCTDPAVPVAPSPGLPEFAADKYRHAKKSLQSLGTQEVRRREPRTGPHHEDRPAVHRSGRSCT